jgi:fructokinase
VSDAWFEQHAIFHICSNTLTDPDIAATTYFAIDKALQFSATVSFDVNLRHNLWSTQHADRDVINRLVEKSHIIKYSKDELIYLADGDTDTYITHCLAHSCQLIIVTDGENNITYYTDKFKGIVAPPSVNAIDTTAGGDGFMGGVLFALSQQSDLQHWLTQQSALEHVITFATTCGAFAVTKPGAFPALPSKTDILNQSTRFIDIFSEQ